MPLDRLTGKFALITGATAGIGLAEGATLAITGRTDQGLRVAREELGKKAHLIKSDASVMEDQNSLANNWLIFSRNLMCSISTQAM